MCQTLCWARGSSGEQDRHSDFPKSLLGQTALEKGNTEAPSKMLNTFGLSEHGAFESRTWPRGECCRQEELHTRCER